MCQPDYNIIRSALIPLINRVRRVDHEPKKRPKVRTSLSSYRPAELTDKRTGPSVTHYGGKYYLKDGEPDPEV